MTFYFYLQVVRLVACVLRLSILHIPIIFKNKEFYNVLLIKTYLVKVDCQLEVKHIC